MVHETREEEALRRVSGVLRSPRASAGAAGAAGGGRSVLAALGGGAGAAGAPGAPGGRALGAAAAYLGAARYVAGARIDTSLFHPLAMRSHHGT